MTWFCLASIILELAAFAMANRCLKERNNGVFIPFSMELYLLHEMFCYLIREAPQIKQQGILLTVSTE